jgi:hypothetical protein
MHVGMQMSESGLTPDGHAVLGMILGTKCEFYSVRVPFGFSICRSRVGQDETLFDSS